MLAQWFGSTVVDFSRAVDSLVALGARTMERTVDRLTRGTVTARTRNFGTIIDLRLAEHSRASDWTETVIAQIPVERSIFTGRTFGTRMTAAVECFLFLTVGSGIVCRAITAIGIQ